MTHEKAIALLQDRVDKLVYESNTLNWAIIGAGTTSERGIGYIEERRVIDEEVNDLRLAISELSG